MHFDKTVNLKAILPGRSIAVFMLCVLFFLINQEVFSSENKSELVILNWSEYMDSSMIKAFEKKYKVKVKEIYFESDDARDQILLQTEGKGFDLILCNGAVIDTYRKRGWLQAIPFSKIPNRKYLDKKRLSNFKSSDEYGIPYFWGTLGIAYRKDIVSRPITSWNQLFRPDKELQGKILMVKSSRDIIGMALKALGYSSNSEDNKELDQAEALLLSQKPYVARYGYLTLEKDSAIVKGQVIAATVYSGDALNVAQYNENIVYVLPEEGGNIWVDYFTLSSHSKHAALATSFINFINQPKWAAKNAEQLYFATPNVAAKKYLSKEFLNDPVIYPDKTLLNRSESYKKLSPRANRRRAEIFTQVVK